MGEFFGSPVKLPKTELPQCCVHPTTCPRISVLMNGVELALTAILFMVY